MFLSISQMSYVGIKSPDNGYFSCYFGQIALCTLRHLENGGNYNFTEVLVTLTMTM